LDKESKGAAGEGKGKATEDQKKGGETWDSVNYLKKAERRRQVYSDGSSFFNNLFIFRQWEERGKRRDQQMFGSLPFFSHRGFKKETQKGE
jgi:hypothetical protein